MTAWRSPLGSARPTFRNGVDVVEEGDDSLRERYEAIADRLEE